MENKWERVPYAEHPDRCQGIRKNNQCWNFRIEGSQFCHACGGYRAGQEAQKRELKQMLSNSFMERVKAQESNPSLLSLTTEVAAIKEMMRLVMLKMTDDHSVQLHSTSLANLCVQSEKLVTACTRLQERLGNMMSSQQALEFASEIMTIVGEEVQDEGALERIHQRIIASLERLETSVKLGRREAG